MSKQLKQVNKYTGQQVPWYEVYHRKGFKKEKEKKSTLILSGNLTIVENIKKNYGDDDVELNVLGCRLTY